MTFKKQLLVLENDCKRLKQSHWFGSTLLHFKITLKLSCATFMGFILKDHLKHFRLFPRDAGTSYSGHRSDCNCISSSSMPRHRPLSITAFSCVWHHSESVTISLVVGGAYAFTCPMKKQNIVLQNSDYLLSEWNQSIVWDMNGLAFALQLQYFQ